MNTATTLKPCYSSITLPEMVGRPRLEVYGYLKETYGEDKLAKIPDDLNSLSDKFKDGNRHCFFGSLLDLDGEAGVPSAYWDGCGWGRIALWFSYDYQSYERVILLEDLSLANKRHSMSTDAIPELQYRSDDIPEMVNKPITEVYEYLRKIFDEDKLAKIPEEVNTFPDEFKDGNMYVFFGSHDIVGVCWNSGMWERKSLPLRPGSRLLSVWLASFRVVLLDDWIDL